MPRRLIALTAALLAAAPVATAAADDAEFAKPDEPGPALSVPTAALDAALQCSPDVGPGAKRNAVLLFQGTGARAKDNWSWTYQPALTKRGIPHCTVDSPEQATGDIQVAGEYVVHAIRAVAGRTGRKVALVGHSQGGMVPRFALRFWPDTRGMVEDVVGFAPSNHGTTAGGGCDDGSCSAAGSQQQASSNFIRALNSYAETWKGIDYTSVYTRTDETVQPNQDETGSSSLRTGEGRRRNVATQDVCPTATYEHLMIGTVDPVAYALAIDALDNDGPADPSRIPLTVCAQPYHEGVNTATVAFDAAAAIQSFQSYRAKTVPREPALRCYVTATCRANGTIASPPVKRCVSKRRFDVLLPGLRGLKVTLNGKALKVRRPKGGRPRTTVDLRGRSKGIVTLKVRGRVSSGRLVVQTRRYRTCG